MKRILTLILALSMICCFVACGNEAETADKKTEDKAPAAEATEATDNNAVAEGEVVEEKPATGGTLKMATNAAFPPYEYKEGEEFKGIDVEIAGALFENKGYSKVEDGSSFTIPNSSKTLE